MKKTIVKKIVTSRGFIPVTVGTFEAWGVGVGGWRGYHWERLANLEPRTYMAVSKNRVPQNRFKYTMILALGPPQNWPLIF